MRTIRIAIFALFATLGARPVTAQSHTACVSPADACVFFDSFLAALNRRDWDAFRATFADDISGMFDSRNQPERRDGRSAVEEMFRAIFPTTGAPARLTAPPIQPDNLLVQDFGDVVIVSFHLRSPGVTGRRTIVLHRTAARWQVVHIHASSFELSTAK